MQHLFNSVVRCERPTTQQVKGMPTATWQTVPGGDRLRCRLDMNFLRPGKDVPPAVEAGKAPDRIGLLFCGVDHPLRAGDRVVAIANDVGQIPVPGTFEIRTIPDVVQGFSWSHHVEIQVIETNQQNIVWPDDEETP
jgi:hypothetical protein